MILGADYHLMPGQLLKDRLDYSLGDLIMPVPKGRQAYKTREGRKTIESIARNTKVLIPGNHDPAPALRDLFKDYPEIQIAPGPRIERGVYILEHGHLFSPDWRYLSKVAPWWSEAVTRYQPSRWLWYQFCERMGWNRPPRSHIGKDYGDWLWLLWRNGEKSLEKESRPKILIMGHTHREKLIVDPSKCKVINLPAGIPLAFEL